MATTMIQDKSLNQSALCGHLVLHMHNLDHVQVNVVTTADSLDSLYHDIGQWIGNARVDLGHQR